MDKRMKLRHYYEAIEMINYMKEGYSRKEIAEKFSVHPLTVKNRLKAFKDCKPDIYEELMGDANKDS